jgi:hypothetical protein
MKTIYRELRAQIAAEKMLTHTAELLQLELGQTFPCYHASARRTLEILQETGIPNAELISFPADGKTAYQDKITPLGWDASCGKLTILEGAGIEPGFIAADYQRHPFHLIKGSCATAPGGEEVRIIEEAQLSAGADCRDALVLIPADSGPVGGRLKTYLNYGVKGVISDYAMNAQEAPDGIQWCNAFTENANWHVTVDDRPFIAFSVTPRTGKLLRQALSQGVVRARIECDGRRYEDTVALVTACVPGRRREECWLLAHLYEPLGNDNSSGVAAAIETARILQQRGQPEFSLRLLFGLEHYGFAAYASRRGNNLSQEVIGACNYDAMYLRQGWGIDFRCASPALPFYGNYLGKLLADELRGEPDVPAIKFRNSFPCMYDDDSFLGDSTTGVPTVWPFRTGKNFWHNSVQTIDYVQQEPFAVGCAINAAFVAALIYPEERLLAKVLPVARELLQNERQFVVGSQKKHLALRCQILSQDLENFSRAFPPEKVTPLLEAWQQETQEMLAALPPECALECESWSLPLEQVVPERLTCGLPYDLAKVPPAERVPLPGRVLYGPLAAILSAMDGKRNLAQILRRVSHETRHWLSQRECRPLLAAIRYLSQYGYLALHNRNNIDNLGILLEEPQS